MTQPDWLARWREGRIGFHRATPHPALVRHWSRLALPASGQVLVPLCGKSEDMRWLAARGHPVLGIELSPLALEQFVAEGDAPATRYRRGDFACVRQGRVELWCGDFFHFRGEPATALAGFYDRAALIALPSPARQRYAHHLAQLLLPGAQGLLVTLTHAEGDAGPPFSVTEAEVERLLAPNFELELCETGRAEDGLQEQVWQLTRRGPARQAVAG
ncbi:thiopurine S-methyltransferase [Salinicola avicenniae]|uniref:thiopurine S-methyltransferase n=1 Tax=Salinicola avicenniae TaxID=2916836 RepID=UPI0020737F70|nr:MULTISPECIES: thiopurine S-methyltransferase [unclassified Salinicola]